MKRLGKWGAISIGGLFALLIVIGTSAGEPDVAIFTIGLLGLGGAAIWLVVAALRNKPKRLPLWGFMVFLLLLVINAAITGPEKAEQRLAESEERIENLKYEGEFRRILSLFPAMDDDESELLSVFAPENAVWRDQLALYAMQRRQSYMKLRQDAEEVMPPAKAEEAHAALLATIDSQLVAASSVRAAMVAFADGDVGAGMDLIEAAARHMEEANDSLRFAENVVLD